MTGDVGQNLLEEVNILKPGQDYGWPLREGKQAFGKAQPSAGLAEPIADYDRKLGASVTGGIIYRGPALPELSGTYIFADFASGRIFALPPKSAGRFTEIAKEPNAVVSFGSNPADGELLFCNLVSGKVRRLTR
jgi:glucose/arabinose dehydrogenase